MANTTYKPLEGTAELSRVLQDFLVAMEARVISGALRKGAKEVEAFAKDLVPERTGELKDSIKIRRQVSKKRGFVNFFVTAGDRKSGQGWYAHLVEYGTGPHEIRPRKAKSLFIAGLLRTVVNHPGAKGAGFMRRAFDKGSEPALTSITAEVKAGVGRLLKRRAKGRI